jgi:hypothetical protein
MATLIFTQASMAISGTQTAATGTLRDNTRLLFHTSASTPPFSGMIAGGANGACSLVIYTGAMPDAAAFSDRTSRDSDVLIDFQLPAYSGTTAGSFINSNIAGGNRVLVGLNPATTAAVQTGVASWFWIGRNVNLTDMNNTTSDTSGTSFMIGTVGIIGSGSDLEIPDINIVSGQTYRSAGFYAYFPYSQTLL